MAAWGMDARSALRAATTVAARVLGLGEELGVLAPGYRADLVALAADPFQSPQAQIRPCRLELRLRGSPSIDVPGHEADYLAVPAAKQIAGHPQPEPSRASSSAAGPRCAAPSGPGARISEAGLDLESSHPRPLLDAASPTPMLHPGSVAPGRPPHPAASASRCPMETPWRQAFQSTPERRRA